MMQITIDDKNKKKKEQQQNTQPTQPATTEQTTTTETTTEQPQQLQGPVLWKTKDEEINFNNELFDTYLKNYEPRENAIQQHENSYLNKMSNIYGLINKNSEKTKEALKKQPIADAFNMLGTAVGKLSEVASNATFGGRVAPKKVDSSDIAKQGNALLKKSYELPQYLQAIDNDIIQNKAKQLQNEYAVNMNRLQRQMQYIQNAIEKATTKTEKEYLSQAAIELEEQKIEMKRKHNEKMEQLAEDRNQTYKTSVYANANGQKMEYDYLTINGVPYPVEPDFVYDVLTKSDLFTPEERDRLDDASTAIIRGEIQNYIDKGKFPQYYINTKGTKKIPFPFMKMLKGSGTHTKKVY